MEEWGMCMNKVKTLWKQRKKIWREYRTGFLIEIIFLCVALTATGLLIRMSQKSWETKLELMTKNVQNLVNENLDTRKSESANDLKNNVYIGLKDILPNTEDMKWNSKFGLSLKFLDGSGVEKYGLEDEEVACVWTSYNQETNELEKECISLSDCFEHWDGDGMTEFQNFYRQQDGHVSLQKLKGYYNGNVFNVREVQFQSTVHKDQVLNIQTISAGGLSYKNPVYRVANLSDVSDAELDDVTLEQGGIDLFVYLPSKSVQYTLNSQQYKQQTYVEGSINGFNLASYQISMYADTFYLATHDGNLKNFTLPIWLIGQAAAVFLIVVYLYLHKKRKELASLRNTFINAMAHEMKTPAAVIKNSAECLEDGIHPEKQANYIKMIQAEADHMNDLLMSMLTYTRLSDSEYDLHKSDCSLKEMMEFCSAHYGEQIEKKGIHVVWDTVEEGTVNADEKMLSMVMDNFISNAVRFCTTGGVIRLTVTKDYVSVYNEGEPIPDDQLKAIWTPMYLGDDSRTKTNGTSGMGLAISAIILKAHHADYGVSNVAEGMEFYFKIPS